MATTPFPSSHAWRIIRWGLACALLALPAVAMQFTREVNWTVSDFAFAAVMLFGACALFEMALRASGSRAYRLGALLTIGGCFILTWGNLAVGILGSETNPLNLMFFALPLAALAGAALCRLRPRGMQKTLEVMALLQVSIAFIALGAGFMIAPMTLAFAVLWLVCASLFKKAAALALHAQP